MPCTVYITTQACCTLYLRSITHARKCESALHLTGGQIKLCSNFRLLQYCTVLLPAEWKVCFSNNTVICFEWHTGRFHLLYQCKRAIDLRVALKAPVSMEIKYFVCYQQCTHKISVHYCTVGYSSNTIGCGLLDSTAGVWLRKLASRS